MEGAEIAHMEKYKQITNDWKYGASCLLTPVLVLDSAHFNCLIFVTQRYKLRNKQPMLLFFNYLEDYRTDGEMYRVQNVSFILLYNFHSKHFYMGKYLPLSYAGDAHKNIQRSSCSVYNFCPLSTKTEMSRQFLYNQY